MALVACRFRGTVQFVHLRIATVFSKPPAAGCGVALAVLHHDANHAARTLFGGAVLLAVYLQEFLRDDGSVREHSGTNACHPFLVGVKIEHAPRAWFFARGLPKSW